MIKLLLWINPIVWVPIIAYVLYTDYEQWNLEVYQPLLQSVETEKKLLKSLEKKLGQIEEFRAQKNEKIAEMDGLRKKLEEAKREFPSKSELPNLLKSLADISEKIGMEFSSFKPGGTQAAAEGLRSAKINVELAGSYVQVMSFLDSVSNLERIVNTEKLELKPSGQIENTNFKSVRAKMEIQTYYFGGG